MIPVAVVVEVETLGRQFAVSHPSSSSSSADWGTPYPPPHPAHASQREPAHLADLQVWEEVEQLEPASHRYWKLLNHDQDLRELARARFRIMNVVLHRGNLII